MLVSASLREHVFFQCYDVHNLLRMDMPSKIFTVFGLSSPCLSNQRNLLCSPAVVVLHLRENPFPHLLIQPEHCSCFRDAFTHSICTCCGAKCPSNWIQTFIPRKIFDRNVAYLGPSNRKIPHRPGVLTFADDE